MSAVKEYGKKLKDDELVAVYKNIGTVSMADFTNYIGALPVRNFSSGQQTGTDERLQLGGEYIRELTIERGGKTAHACMPGCLIECSNVYVDASGKEIVSPVEYETIGLMGTNCGLKDPDELARVNEIANDLGIDTIEAGATIGVLMEAGIGEFGDVNFMVGVLEDNHQEDEDLKEEVIFVIICPFHYSKLSLERNHK